MDELLFDYDLQLYDRRFLNCFQRHAVVFLQRLGVPVDLLFYNALPDSDTLLEQIVKQNKAKYALHSPYFAETDLTLLGVRFQTRQAECLADLLPVIHQQIARYGCAFLSGDVFYFNHCPEYRASHAQHVIVLRGCDEDGVWDIVDDNPASVLCQYRYTGQQVDAFFQNDGARRMFCLTLDSLPAEPLTELFAQRHRQFIAQYSDSYWLYRHLDQLLDNPLVAPAIKYRALHDVFTLLAGSRNCFAHYLTLSNAPAAVIEQVHLFSSEAEVLKGLMVMAQVTGKVRRADLLTRCAALEQIEHRYLAALRSSHALVTTVA